VGYAVGYFVRGREAGVPPSNIAATAATTGTSAKPGTGEGVVPPTGAPSAVSETPDPKPAATMPTPSPAPKPATPAAAARSSNATAPKTGRVVINSSPAKAGVTINGKWSGRTPLTVDDLKFGKYVVRIVEPGYEVEREQFTLSPKAASREVDVTLKRKPGAKAPQPAAKAPQPQASAGSASAAAATGTIYVDSRPQGARVFLDNKEQGVTPVTLTGQAPGSRVVRLELPDHSPRSETVTLKPGATARVTGSLERIR
jgi:hypothetical protein